MTARFPVLAVALLVSTGATTAPLGAHEPIPATRNAHTSPATNEILERAMAAYIARMEGIDNYTIVQSVMGVESVTYFEREMVDGKPPYRSRVVSVGGQMVPGASGDWEDPVRMMSQVMERATLRGTEAVDGHRVYAVVIEDLSDIEGFGGGSSDLEDARFERMVMYLDVDSYVVRRVEMEGTAVADGVTREVSITTVMEDYRNVQGMLHPFRVTMNMGAATSGISEAEIAEARVAMAQLEAQMAEMPAAQRQMMERMIRPQMERLQGILSGDGQFVVETKEIRVNQGPPVQ